MEKLKLRSKIKSKKPDFKVQDSHKKSRVSSTKWRKPKGIQSKVRLQKKGYNKKVKVGYGSPNEVKGADKSGLFPVIVNNIKDLASVDAKTQGIVLSSTVGMRKKSEIVKAASEKKLTILNVKDASSYVSGVDKEMADRKAKKTEVSKEKKQREAKIKDAKKEAKTEEVKEKKASEKAETKTESKKEKVQAEESDAEPKTDAKKTKEKQEKDKVLTKKQ